MIVGSTKEDLKSEKRVSLTPETTKNIIGLGLEILIERIHERLKMFALKRKSGFSFQCEHSQ